jgi:predicted nucleic-acid-binding protein
MLAVDTNVLVRLLARDDSRQALAADQAVAKGGWISHLVLAEAMWVLDAVYARTSRQLLAALELLLEHETLVVQDAEVVAAALVHMRAKPALGFSDCLVLEIARKAGHLPLATFDKALAKVAGAQLL